MCWCWQDDGDVYGEIKEGEEEEEEEEGVEAEYNDTLHTNVSTEILTDICTSCKLSVVSFDRLQLICHVDDNFYELGIFIYIAVTCIIYDAFLILQFIVW